MKVERVGVGVLEEIEVCHTHQQSKMPSLFIIFFNYLEILFHIVSIPVISFVQEGIFAPIAP